MLANSQLAKDDQVVFIHILYVAISMPQHTSVDTHISSSPKYPFRSPATNKKWENRSQSKPKDNNLVTLKLYGMFIDGLNIRYGNLKED